jgi:hypothetical protein
VLLLVLLSSAAPWRVQLVELGIVYSRLTHRLIRTKQVTVKTNLLIVAAAGNHGTVVDNTSPASNTNAMVCDAYISQGDAKSSLGDAKSSLGDAESSLGDAESSLSDAKSSLGDAKSSLGDA